MMPRGMNKVVPMNSPPSMNSQYGARKPEVKKVLRVVDDEARPAPRRSACRGHRPRPRSPLRSELAGANSPGLMMPTCGT